MTIAPVALTILLALATTGVAASLLPSTAHPGSVAPPGYQPPPGFITKDDHFFVQVGSPVFGLAFNPVYNGSQLFTAYLTVVLYPLTNATQTAYLRLYEVGRNGVYANATVVVLPFSASTVQVPVPSSDHYIEVELVVDGTSSYYYTETPVLILSIAGFYVGGVDLVAIVALAEFLILALPVMTLARKMAKRAMHAPRLKAVIWLHGIVLSGLALWIADFPSLNVLFGGWEWVVFPIPAIVFLFFWEAGRHNSDKKVELERANPRAGHRLGFDKWYYHVGTTSDGSLVFVGQLWRDFFYGATGHYTYAYVRPTTGAALVPVPGDVLLRASAPPIVDVPARVVENTEGKTSPADDFEVTNRANWEDDKPVLKYFVDSADPVSVTWPKLSFHQEVDVPAKVSKDGVILIPARKKRTLAWPHVIDGHAEVRLASIHYADVYAVALGWKQTEDLVREVEELARENWVLKTEVHSRSERKAASRLAVRADLVGRPLDDLGPEDAAAYIDEKRGRPRGPDRPATPKEGAE